MNKQNITRLDIVNYISHGISKVHDDDDDGIDPGMPADDEASPEAPARNPLEAYTVNLNEQARLGKIDPLIGREAELIGVSDHTLAELHDLVNMASAGDLDPSPLVAHTVPLDAQAINRTLDALERHQAPVRTVIMI